MAYVPHKLEPEPEPKVKLKDIARRDDHRLEELLEEYIKNSEKMVDKTKTK